VVLVQPSRPLLQRNQPAAASTPACRIPPPSAFL